MRAVIDIGTNSVLLLIGSRREDGKVEVDTDRATVTRLGQGVGSTGLLEDEAIARTVRILGEYASQARTKTAELVVVATAGLRLASNRDAFLEPATEALGVPVRLISGDEEARLSYLSVAAEQASGHLRVLDIGGGSTELVVGEGTEVVSQRSHPVGSVRFSEQFVDRDPPGLDAVSAIEAAARESFANQPISPYRELVGLAGTVTTCAALLLGLDRYDRAQVDGSEFSRDAVASLRDQLATETMEQRCARPVLEPGRADVVVAGTTILVAALDHCGADTLVVRDRGLRYALV